MKTLFENRNILLLSFGTFLQFAGLDGFQQYYAAAYEARGESQFAVASLVILYFCFWVFSHAKFAPAWSTKISPAHALFLGAIPYSFLPAAVAINSKPLILIAAALVGVGAALFWISSGIVLNSSSSAGTIGRNTSFQLTALYLGGLLSTFFGTPFILHDDFGSFAVLCSLASVIGALVYLCIGVEKKESPSEQAEEVSEINSRYLYLSVFAAFFVALLAISSIKILIAQVSGAAGVTLVGNGIKIAALAACLAGGFIADRFDPARVLIATSISGLVGLLLFVTSGSLVQITVASVLVATFFASIRPIYLSLIRSRTSREGFFLPHSVYARYTTQGMFAGLLASLLIPPTTTVLIALILVALSLISLLAFTRRFPILTPYKSPTGDT